jgi:hypothetical protein
MLGFHALVFFGIHESQLADVENLLPTGVHRSAGVRAEQPMQTGFEGVIAPSPTRGESSRRFAHFQDFGLVTAPPHVNSSAKSCDASANDDYLLGLFRHALLVGTFDATVRRFISGNYDGKLG